MDEALRFWSLLVLLICSLAWVLFGRSLASIPIEFRVRGSSAHLLIDSNDIKLDTDAAFPLGLILRESDPLKHEIQIDGTDSINNATYDPDYFEQFSKTFYYKLQDWMRGGGSYNRWHDYKLIEREQENTLAHMTKPPLDYFIPIQSPKSNNYDIQVFLSYPEASAKMSLVTGTRTSYTVQINRNNRALQVDQHLLSGEVIKTVFKGYFPRNPWPFLGENLISFARVILAAWMIVLFCLLLGLVTAGLLSNISIDISCLRCMGTSFITNRWTVYCILAGSLSFTLFIALYDYNGQPHILDGVAYFFQAKILALGRLNVPIPEAHPWLKGPFMVSIGERWFTLFPPGTPFVLSLGMQAGVPWLVEPVLGTAALWGIYAVARRWYSPGTAFLALVLAALSPFHSFLAASYLSHTVCLFFLVYMCYFLQSYCRDAVATGRPRRRDLLLSAFCLGAAFFTREFTAVVVGGILLVGIPLGYFWRKQGKVDSSEEKKDIPTIQLKLLISSFLLYVAVLIGVFSLYLCYNGLQTGNIFLLPRLTFSPNDKYGFGEGVGFYGQHTVAAGLVILDQLFTSLQIELYGWPYLATLAFSFLPFMLGKANRWDWLCLLISAALFLTHIGFYYHSIAIGPRHLYEALPFYVMLTARGVIISAGRIAEWTQNILGKSKTLSKSSTSVAIAGWPIYFLVIICIGCNLIYYTPRHVQVYHDFAGLPASYHLNVKEIYHHRLHNAVVVTNDWLLFNNVLAPLNDPLAQGDVLFAFDSTSRYIDIIRLIYPTRTFYRINVLHSGKVQYTPIPPEIPD